MSASAVQPLWGNPAAEESSRSRSESACYHHVRRGGLISHVEATRTCVSCTLCPKENMVIVEYSDATLSKSFWRGESVKQLCQTSDCRVRALAIQLKEVRYSFPAMGGDVTHHVSLRCTVETEASESIGAASPCLMWRRRLVNIADCFAVIHAIMAEEVRYERHGDTQYSTRGCMRALSAPPRLSCSQ